MIATNPCLEIPLYEPKPMPNPSPADLESPDFLVIWEVIKDWDINVPGYYNGYSIGNGGHVMLILEKIRQQIREQKINDIIEDSI